jgi:hypothetical protein
MLPVQFEISADAAIGTTNNAGESHHAVASEGDSDVPSLISLHRTPPQKFLFRKGPPTGFGDSIRAFTDSTGEVLSVEFISFGGSNDSGASQLCPRTMNNRP